MKKNIFKIGLLSTTLLFPIITFAAGKTLGDIVVTIIRYFNVAIALIIGLAMVTFVWNVYRYFFTDKNKTDAGKYVLYSIIGFFVILSIWGLVAILTNTLKLDNTTPDYPFFRVGGSLQQPQTNPPLHYNAGTGFTNNSPHFNALNWKKVGGE